MTLGPPLLPVRAVYARNVFSPHVRIFGLLLGLTQTENTVGTTLNTCCLNARVFCAREARCRLHFSGMTSLRRVLGLIMHQRCCLQHVLLIEPPLCLPAGATACLVPLLLDPRCLLLHWDVPSPWRMKLQFLSLVAFLLGLSSAACTRLPPSELVLASLPAWSSVHSWLLCLQSGSLSATALFPAPTPVLYMSAPVRRRAVADGRLGLARSPIVIYFFAHIGTAYARNSIALCVRSL